MLKFIWGKGSQPTPERLKIQEELFGFTKVRQLIFIFILAILWFATILCLIMESFVKDIDTGLCQVSYLSIQLWQNNII